MAIPIAAGMLLQTLYYFVDLYFVAYMGFLGADAGTVQAGTTFLHWFIPGLALQFALVVMGSGLRGTGIVKPTRVPAPPTAGHSGVVEPGRRTIASP